MSDPSNNIPTTTNNVLKTTNIYGGLAVLDNPTGSIGRMYVQRDAKIDGVLVVNDRLIDASFIDIIDTIPSVDNKILIATQNVSQQANSYTDNKIALLVGTADESLNSIQELAQAIQNNASLVDSIYSVIGTKTTMGDVQTYLNTNYYDKPTIDTKITQTIATAQTDTAQAIAPLTTEINNVKTGLNQKITATDMATYVTQNTYSKTYLDTTYASTLSQANQYTNSAIQNITGFETTASTNTKLEQLQLQINQKANINNASFTGIVSGITKNMVGLSAVDNTTDLNKPISTATQSALNLKANINNPTFSGLASFTGLVSGISKSMVGLGNVNNTADLNKPISNATQTALNAKSNVIDPTFTNNVTINGALNSFGNFKFSNDATQTTHLSFNKSNETFGFYRDTSTNIWGFDGVGNLYTAGGLNTQNRSTFNKMVTISETAPSMNLLLTNKLKASRLFFLSGANAGNYNPITANDDSLIIYDNTVQDTGALNICCWSNNPNGLKLTSNLTKVFGNFEVANGSIVGSPIFRPTGNSAFGLGNNVFNSSALLQPLIYNGITNGNGNNALFTEFNVSFNSWKGTGFVCTANNTCNAVIDHTNGNFSTKGNLTCSNMILSGNLNMNNSDIFARSMALSNSLFVTNITANGQINVSNSVTANDIYTKGVNLFNQVQPLNNSRLHTLTYSATPLSNSSEGLSQVTAYTFSIPARCSDKITFTIPIAFHRDFRINGMYNTLSITEHITAQATVTKNGVLFGQSASNLLESIRSVYIINQKKPTTVYSYDLYAGNIYFEFTPTYDTVANTYLVNLSHNAIFTSNEPNSQTFLADFIVTNTAVTNFFSSVNTDFATIITSPSPNLSYTHVPASSSIEIVKTQSNITNEYTEFNNPVFVNQDLNTFDINSNGTIQSTSLEVNGNITAEQMTITGDARIFGAVTINNGLAGYHIDGLANYRPTPVFCSMKSFVFGNSDNYWYINAGFKIEIYNSNNYVSWIKTMDNTNGTTGVLYTLTEAERDRAESFKIYYLNVEVFIPPLS